MCFFRTVCFIGFNWQPTQRLSLDFHSSVAKLWDHLLKLSHAHFKPLWGRQAKQKHQKCLIKHKLWQKGCRRLTADWEKWFSTSLHSCPIHSLIFQKQSIKRMSIARRLLSHLLFPFIPFPLDLLISWRRYWKWLSILPAKPTCRSKNRLYSEGEWMLAVFSVLVLFVDNIYKSFFSQNECWFINAARRPFNNKYADRVKVFGDTLFLLGENVSLEEMRISAILMTKHVCCLKGSQKLMESHIIPREAYNPSTDIKGINMQNFRGEIFTLQTWISWQWCAFRKGPFQPF